MTTPTLLPPEAVAKLNRLGKRYAALQRATSRREWYFGQYVNELWQTLPSDAQEELTAENWYMECSSHINALLDFPVVGKSGRTLRYWCEVARHYETFPNVLVWKSILTFSHFAKARTIGADPLNNVTSDHALALAVENDWTADEMKAALTFNRQYSPTEQALLDQFPAWLGRLPLVLLSMNGNSAQAEYHLREFCRLKQESEKK